jgi:hypothetical protein
MKVYVLTEGNYDEFNIVGIFTSMDRLNDFKAKIPNNGYNRHKEYHLDPNNVELICSGLRPWLAYIELGEAIKPEESDDLGDTSQCEMFKLGKRNVLSARVWARDENHAIALMEEERQRFIASGERQNGTQG